VQCQVKKGKKTILNPKENDNCLISFYGFAIREECLSKKNSWATLIGGGYERPNSDICPDDLTFLAGSEYFQVSEFEVYQVPERKEKEKNCKQFWVLLSKH